MEIDQRLEQWINIKFLVKLGKNGPEIHQMLQQVYGEYALKERIVFKFVQRFREGHEDPKYDARSGHPSTSSGNEYIDRVCSLMLSDRRLTVRMVAELGLGKSSIHTILMEHLEMEIKNQNMLMVFFDCHGIVQHEFTPEGKNVNAAFYVELLKHLRDRVYRVDRNFGRGGYGFSTTTMPPCTLN